MLPWCGAAILLVFVVVLGTTLTSASILIVGWLVLWLVSWSRVVGCLFSCLGLLFLVLPFLLLLKLELHHLFRGRSLCCFLPLFRERLLVFLLNFLS